MSTHPNLNVFDKALVFAAWAEAFPLLRVAARPWSIISAGLQKASLNKL